MAIQHGIIPYYDSIFAAINLYDPLSSNMLSTNLHSIVSSLPVLKPADGQKEAWTSQIGAVSSARSDYVTPEQLSHLWGIGINLAERTLKATTHQFIWTTGALTKCLKTEMA